MERCRKSIQLFRCAFALLVLVAFPLDVRGSDDDVPFFLNQGSKGLPNVMFIFDNSDSMQDYPYPRIDEWGAKIYESPDMEWRKGVKVDRNGYLVANSNGELEFDEYEYGKNDSEIELLGRTPPELPGPGGYSSKITSVEKEKDKFICDDSIDWESDLFSGSGFEANYANRKVRVSDENGNVQYTNIVNCASGAGKWIVDPEIEYHKDENGSYLDYTYEISIGRPNFVTREVEQSDRVFDCNVDWNWAVANKELFKDQRLEIVDGLGTLLAFSSKIVNVNSNGFWQVRPPFPIPLPYDAKYRIVGSLNDDRWAKGGNHPASKMYQAKEALRQFLESDKIKFCEMRNKEGFCTSQRYLFNLGFATYMTARSPRVKAKYYRRNNASSYADPPQYEGEYKRYETKSVSFQTPNSTSQFMTKNWKTRRPGIGAWKTDQKHTSVYAGYRLERLFHEGTCNEESVVYTVKKIEETRTDSGNEDDFIAVFTLEGSEPVYAHKKFSVNSCEDLPKEPSGGWKLLTPVVRTANNSAGTRADACPHECSFYPGESTSYHGSYYDTTYKTTWGDHAETDPNKAGYVHRNLTPLSGAPVTPCPGYDRADTGKCISNPNPELGDYTLVAETIRDVPIDGDYTIGNIEPNTLDVSEFVYPADGSTGRPHGWSYRKTDRDCVYGRNRDNPSNWQDNIQPTPYFPASTGNEQANHAGHDQVVFLNLPEYKSNAENFGDDVNGANIERLMEYIGLARVESPDLESEHYSKYDYTMMPYSNSLAVSGDQETQGVGTPLAASLKNAREYYESYFQQDVKTGEGCRENYVVLLTDGLETCGGDPEQEAAALYNMTVDGKKTEIKTYVIGFGLDEDAKKVLDGIAKAGGTEKAYFANNVEELVEILSEDIAEDILGESYSRSSPVLSRRTLPQEKLKIYNSYFDYPVWRGHLEGRYLKANGDIGEPLEGWTGNCFGKNGQPDGDAGCEMAKFGRGRVLTNFEDELVEFRPSSVSLLKDLINPKDLDVNGDGVRGSTGDASAIIKYVLDAGFDRKKYAGTRDPAWPLGDIYNSSAVLVSPPKASASYREGYAEFAEENKDRPEMLYVGANDGMLHAIFEETGREAWAFIPGSVLGTLNEFKDGHRFTVDLKIKAADVQTHQGWKTILASGLRKGGSHYYAMDVTDPLDPDLLWEITDENMGQTYSVPSFGQISINGTNVGVIFVGGGYSPEMYKGNRVYIIRANDGLILYEIPVGHSLNNVPSEILAARYPDDQSIAPYEFHTRVSVPSGWRGNIEYCYFGDTSGTLWRLGNLNSDHGYEWKPTLEPIFVPEDPKPITHRPAINDVKDGCHRRFVDFGTGDEIHPMRKDYHYFYEIEDIGWEEYEAAHPDHEWTADQIEAGRFRQKWRYDFTYGEQLLTDPSTYYNLVYFITYKSEAGCSAGTSYLYSLTTSKCSRRGQGTGDGGGGGAGGETDLQTPEGVGGGQFFKFRDDKGNVVESPMAVPGITGSIVISPPKAYFFPGPPISVPTDPGVLLYWREAQ